MKKIATKDSVTCGNEGAYLDLGLALGRSYRVGFGPLGQLFRPDVTDVYMQAGARNSETVSWHSIGRKHHLELTGMV